MMIDHVTLASPDLAELQVAFANLGMVTDYGGPHSNGLTHMALLGFPDGSYIEIVSALKSGDRCPLWTNHTLGPRGGTAWTIATPDVCAEIRRVRALGISACEPQQISRTKPDGTTGRWDLAYLGSGQPGGSLPFLIKDHTPREVRVRPSPSVAPRLPGVPPFGRLHGVALTVLAVHDLETKIDLFKRVYSWVMPDFGACRFGGRFASFRGTPVVLAASESPVDWISEHLRLFGESPCAFLISCGDIEAVADCFGLQEIEGFFGRSVVWLGTQWPGPARLGFIAG